MPLKHSASMGFSKDFICQSDAFSAVIPGVATDTIRFHKKALFLTKTTNTGRTTAKTTLKTTETTTATNKKRATFALG
jgi:hypothetical protein